MKFDVIDIPASKNCYGSRNESKISSIIVHSVGMELKEVFTVFKQYNVSAHYIVPQVSGAELLRILPEIFSELDLQYQVPNLLYPNKIPVIRIVSDENKAFHAGASNFGTFNKNPECHKGLNSESLGIEFHNPMYAKRGEDFYHFASFTYEQKVVGIELIKYLIDKHSIPNQNILAHSTISVGRKTDPGPLFFWKDLHENGLGYLPTVTTYNVGNIINEPSSELISEAQRLMKSIGFNSCPINGIMDDATHQNIDAYIMQFASHLWNGKNNHLSDGLLNSLENFDPNVFMPLIEL